MLAIRFTQLSFSVLEHLQMNDGARDHSVYITDLMECILGFTCLNILKYVCIQYIVYKNVLFEKKRIAWPYLIT